MPEQEEAAPQSPVEDLKAADAVKLHQTLDEEGDRELSRPTWSLFWSGLAAGIAVNTSLLAEGLLQDASPDAPWRHLLVALGYPIGFIIVIMGRMQLFTESTITAVIPLVSRMTMRALRRTIRLWSIVLAANLCGTAITAGLIAAGLLADPAMVEAILSVSMAITEKDPLETFVTAVPAGFLIAVIAWALPNARESAFWFIFALTWLIGAGGFTHSIVGSGEAFLLLFLGHTGPLFTLFGFLVPAIAGNLVGGAGLFAVLAHAQVREELD